ncbi:glycosyltransferase family 2 protein [Treponema zuelzerae]|uniref:Glycosyltransferase family 2 protein n=1 Tax=Teretinema zuelzerae TaxID=156 RepID=A0AAE3EFV0_9SPIR|nr:glycosyltransferase family 2 protein [Teretinema zuelzerae]MCD1653370.1 glycosyltransferase family 2 protein [Teretinema zuelzerae]
MKISVLIPLYKEPKFFVPMVRSLRLNEYEDLEIVAVVDGPMTDSISHALSEAGDSAKVVFPDEHVGKAEALNRAAFSIETDAFLFLDNDIELPRDPTFISRLASKLVEFDIVDMPKEVIVESVFSAMIAHEYQSLAMASLLFSRLVHRSPGVIGAAFAVRKSLFDRLGGFKRVVHEDGDFGARAFRLHARYAYDLSLKVRTGMPDTLDDWIKQRKRWTLINVLWFKDNFLYMAKSVFRQPSILTTLLAIALPSVVSLLLFASLTVGKLSFLNPLIFMIAQSFQFPAGLFLWLSHHAMLSDGLISTLAGFAFTFAVYGSFSAIARFRFNPLSFVLYYLAYAPFIMAINIAMFITQWRTVSVDLEWKT